MGAGMWDLFKSSCSLTDLICGSFLVLTVNEINLIEVVAFLRQKFLNYLTKLQSYLVMF